MYKSWFLFIIMFFAAVGGSVADRVIFNNGDVISGTIEKLTDGQLVINTEMLGTVTVGMDKVQSFRTGSGQDGNSSGRKIEPTPDADPKAVVVPAKVEPAPHKEIVPVDKPDKDKPVWSGEFTGGYTSKSGNTRTTDMNIDMKLKRHTRIHDLIITGEHDFSQKIDNESGEKTTTEESWLLKGKDQFNLTNGFYGYLEASYERNRIANLDSRVMEGFGVGEKWIDTEKTHFQTDIGLANFDEKYMDGTKGNSVSGQAGYAFDHKINGSMSFVHDLTFYPSFEDHSDYYMKSNAELRFHITKRLFTNFKVVYEYDNKPAEDSKNTDTKYIFGVGYKF